MSLAHNNHKCVCGHIRDQHVEPVAGYCMECNCPTFAKRSIQTCIKCGAGMDGHTVCPACHPDEEAHFQELKREAKAVGADGGGVKNDTIDKKSRVDLVSPTLFFGSAHVLRYGAEKYGERNWERGMKWSRPFGGLLRHLWAWWMGEKCDPETGFSHLWHAGCCLMFLAHYEAYSVYAQFDDRPVAHIKKS